MNAVKRVYCRTFQTVLKVAIPFLPYRTPKVVGSVRKLPDILRKQICRCLLIITDQGIRKLGLLRPLERTLKESKIPYVIYDGTVANPTTDNVKEALELYRTNGCNAIVGFGGGSSMDCAKAVGACIAKPKQTLAQMKGILKVHKKLPLLIAIPTTAGTGSETTLVCSAGSEGDGKSAALYYGNDRNGCADSCGRGVYWQFHHLRYTEKCMYGGGNDFPEPGQGL